MARPVLYDRGTESLWLDEDDSLKAVAGKHKGETSAGRPAASVTWKSWLAKTRVAGSWSAPIDHGVSPNELNQRLTKSRTDRAGRASSSGGRSSSGCLTTVAKTITFGIHGITSDRIAGCLRTRIFPPRRSETWHD